MAQFHKKLQERGGTIAVKSPGLLKKQVKANTALYIMLIPALIYVAMFCYAPMYGVVLAFKDFNPSLGIMGSPWVGFKHFIRFFNLPSFGTLIWNTLSLSLYELIAGFPLPILLALFLNHCIRPRYKKVIQTITYSAHFISTVVLVGMIGIFFSQRLGLANHLLQALGFDAVNFLGKPEYFRHIYVWTGVWQNLGWNSIIYVAALSSVNTELYEAASIDGATLFQKIRNIDTPTLLPTATIMLILNFGSIMSVGFEKVFLMQNPLNLGVSEIISTYVYKTGLLNLQYSFSTAVGLFNNIVNIIMLLIVNQASKKLSDTSLF